MTSTRYKIGILGTHGAGKTTLALALAARIKAARPDLAVEALAETARACPLPIGEHTTADSQRWIFCRQMSAEIETAARCQVLVCDRTILDNLAYAEAADLDLAYLFLSAALGLADDLQPAVLGPAHRRARCRRGPVRRREIPESHRRHHR